MSANYRNTVLYGDVRTSLRSLIDAGTRCNMCVTSPPYWSLRSYLPDDHPDKHLELGNEATPEAYIQNMVEVFRLVREVLAPDGTCHIVIGDTHMGTGGPGSQHEKLKKGDNPRFENPNQKHSTIKSKDLCLIPFELAKALRDDGWYLRAVNIWAKAISGQHELLNAVQAAFGWDIDLERLPVGSCMPESVQDRCTVSHEYVLMLSKSKQYFWDAEAIREMNSFNSHGSPNINPGTKAIEMHPSCTKGSLGCWQKETADGRNRRSVWFVPTKGYSGQHFACYPADLISPIIRAGTSQKGHCGAKIPKLRIRGDLDSSQKERVESWLKHKGIL